jgi:hypothetical protein
MLANPDDLFGGPLLPGLNTSGDIVTPAEEQALIVAIEGTDLAPFRFQGWLGKRLTVSFGSRYDFDDRSFRSTDPMPEFLLPLRERAAAFAGLSAEDFVQALLIRYDPGASIGWHRDRPVFDQVVGISLGNAATLRFRRKKPGGFDRARVLLEPRSIYHLSGVARYEWEHSIAAMDVPRWSITFRSLAAKNLTKAR